MSELGFGSEQCVVDRFLGNAKRACNVSVGFAVNIEEESCLFIHREASVCQRLKLGTTDLGHGTAKGRRFLLLWLLFFSRLILSEQTDHPIADTDLGV